MKKNIRILIGVLCLIVFLICCIFLDTFEDLRKNAIQISSIVFLGVGITYLFPRKFFDRKIEDTKKLKLSKRTIFSLLIIFILIPLTVYFGMRFLDERKYYFISLIIIFETILPFCLMFDGKKPQGKELVIISVLCAIAIIGREAFFMLPQFKPLLAIVIISGICFGGETGFLVGAICSFVSNIYFGQGPWTPWQMVTSGIIGMLAGVLFRKGIVRKSRFMLCLFGGLSTLFIYGVIMNIASVLMWAENPTLKMLASSCVAGFYFDLIHAASTVFFLWIAGPSMIEKLERIKSKYGILIHK